MRNDPQKMEKIIISYIESSKVYIIQRSKRCMSLKTCPQVDPKIEGIISYCPLIIPSPIYNKQAAGVIRRSHSVIPKLKS